MFSTDRKDRIGQLSEKISIYKEVTVKDSYGAPEIQKQPVVTNWWAKVEFESMSEELDDDKMNFMQAIKVIMRYVQCREDYIIEYDGRYYNIHYVEPVNRKSYVILKADLIYEPATHLTDGD